MYKKRFFCLVKHKSRVTSKALLLCIYSFLPAHCCAPAEAPVRVSRKAQTHPRGLFQQILVCDVSPSRALVMGDAGAALTSWEKKKKNSVFTKRVRGSAFQGREIPTGMGKATADEHIHKNNKRGAHDCAEIMTGNKKILCTEHSRIFNQNAAPKGLQSEEWLGQFGAAGMGSLLWDQGMS